jgi:quercetin dioxygenase-like cupin family protein
MLFVVSGSSGSGKSTIARTLAGSDQLIVHDSDEGGVPSDADTAWRQHTLEDWMLRAIEYQARGIDMVLTGQSPLGEVLACPSAARIDAIAMCLLDVDDRERRARITARDPGKWDENQLDAFIGWANWHRHHAADPQYLPQVILTGAWESMEWARWRDWASDDPRWRTTVIDTSSRDPAASSRDVRAWITAARDPASNLRIPGGWDLATTGVTVELLATVDLGPEIEGMEGRRLRMRMVTIEPGGVFGPVHDHKRRHGTVYVLQGTITDHRNGIATEYGPGVGWPEDRNTLHWLENRGTVPAVEISVDVVAVE